MSDKAQKDLKFNYALNITEASFWGLGAGLASTAAVLPLFLSKYTDSAILFGLIPAIQTIGFQLPQLFMANRVASQKRIVPFVMRLTIHERVPFLGLAIIALFAESMPPAIVITLIFLMLTWQGIGSGITGNAWQNMIVKIIPTDIRSTFFSIQGAGVNLLMSVGALLAGLLLENQPGTTGYAISFFVAFLAMMVSYVLLGKIREQPETTQNEVNERTPLLRSAMKIMKEDKNFRSFVIIRFLTPFATMASAFYVIYLVKTFEIDEQTVGIMTSVLFISTVISGLLLGWISDHVGRKFALVLCFVIMAIAPLLAFFAQSLAFFYIVFILTGIIHGSFWSVFLAFSLEFGDNQTRPVYIGLVNTLIAPSTLVAQLLGGWIADGFSYQTTFVLAAVFALITALISIVFVKMPHKRMVLDPA